MTQQDIWVLYSTFARSEEALSVAKTLLEKRLIACANIQENVVSLYRWQGAVMRENEVTLIAKTSKVKLQPAMDEVKKLHSYELPCIVAYPIAEGYPPFLQWIKNETA